MKKNLTRRHFLNLVGAAGGSTAIYKTSMALGLMQDTGPVARLDLKDVRRTKKKVAVLGAGISGLMVAYELERVGYDVTIIEASHRLGGRVLTVRHGDVIDEMGHRQVCDFDDDPELYFNAGPARIPGHHRRVMHYCKALDVPLVIKANFSRPAYTQEEGHFGGKPIRIGRYIADARGFMSELLYKAVDKNAFDQPLTIEDRERMMLFAKTYGDLDSNGAYNGTIRAGYKSGGFGKPAEIYEKLDFSELLNSDFWMRGLTGSENPDWGEPLMEIPGGMDGIVTGFSKNIKSPILLNAQVQSIQLKNNGMDIVYHHKGKRKKLAADYSFNCIPTHFMSGIPNNLPEDYKQGLAELKPGFGIKIAEAIGMPCEQGVHPEDHELLLASFKNLSESNERKSIEYRFLTPDGQITWVYGFMAAMKNEAGETLGYIRTVTDITDRKRAEDELHALSEKIKKFSYSITHDLKNPVSVISWISNSLNQRYSHLLDDRGKEFCDIIIRSAKQLFTLIEKINTYISTGENELHLEQFRLIEVMSSLEDEFNPQFAEKGVKLSIYSGTEEIKADKLALTRALRNLVENAVKYGGSKLAEIKTEYREDKHHHLLSVSDDGVGIDSKNNKDIFKEFTRTSTSAGTQGSGLGLAIVQEVASRHGGKAWVESNGDKWTTFYLSIAKQL